MLRTPVSSRPVRAGIGAAALTAAGVALLAGCATAADTTDTSSDSADTSTDTGSSDAGAATYADGTYTAAGSYSTPESVEQISVTVTLESDVITSVEVVGDPQKAESKQYQSQFIGGISDAVVGQDIDEISVSRVAGSSLTSGGFNDAIESIKADAAA